MGQTEILGKLSRELEKDIHEECQVICILSRIRKYLEAENKKDQYKYLNFYCNWALHSKINDTKQVADILLEFTEGKNEGFLRFAYLYEDLNNFLSMNGLPMKLLNDHSNSMRFVKLLVNIYSDTPLIVPISGGQPRIITIKKPLNELVKNGFTVGYEIK